MNKQIYNEKESIDGILKGVNQVADLVAQTMGPKGKNVVIRNQYNEPIITNDGITIAQNIKLSDPLQDTGAALVIAAANKTNTIAGDGTTTTTVLTRQLLEIYFNMKLKETINVVNLQKEMIAAGEEVSNYLLSIAKPVKTIEEIEKVATVSSNSKEIGKLISDAYKNAGEYGTVIVEEDKLGKDSLETIQGMKLEAGIITPYLFTDIPNMKTNWQDVKVLVTTEEINSASDIINLLDMIIKTNTKLLLICKDMPVEVITMIISNKQKGIPIDICPIRLPGVGLLGEQLIDDICLATNATLISRERGRTLKDIKPEDLGELNEILVTHDTSILKFKDESITGINLLELREKRAHELRAQLDKVPENIKQSYIRRAANLVDGLSVIKVSGNSDVEITDKKLRIEDALNSVKSAKEEGVVVGGGYSFIQAKDALKMKLSDRIETLSNTMDTIGAKLVLTALDAPARQILKNAGMDATKILNNMSPITMGYNVLTNRYEDLSNTGVINSVKVDRYSLINAISVASTVITMCGAIIENTTDEN